MLVFFAGCAGDKISGQTSCTSEADCDEGWICMEGMCRKICNFEADCAEGYTCRDEICVELTSCSGQGSCGEGKTCRDGYCRFACAEDGDCLGNGEECIRGACLPAPPDEALCDGEDNNDNGKIDEDFDDDGDGYTVCGSWNGSGFTPPSPAYEDCDDANSDIHPGAMEICGNDIDEDCSGYADDGICLQELRITRMGIVSGGGMASGDSHEADVRLRSTQVVEAQGDSYRLMGRLRAVYR
jgi:hypothetical protein